MMLQKTICDNVFIVPHRSLHTLTIVFPSYDNQNPISRHKISTIKTKKNLYIVRSCLLVQSILFTNLSMA